MESFKDKLYNLFLEAVSENCEKKFGRVLFGEFKKFYKKELEKDTEYEKDIFNYIIKFIRGDYVSAEKDDILITAFNTLKKCKKDYPIILEPNENILYRGFGVDPNKISKLKFNDKKINKYYRYAPYTYNGRSSVQSWTPSFSVATGFSEDAILDGLIPAVIKSRLNKNDLLFNTKFLNIAFKESGFFSAEDEIIRVSNKPVSGVIIINEEDL